MLSVLKREINKQFRFSLPPSNLEFVGLHRSNKFAFMQVQRVLSLKKPVVSNLQNVELLQIKSLSIMCVLFIFKSLFQNCNIWIELLNITVSIMIPPPLDRICIAIVKQLLMHHTKLPINWTFSTLLQTKTLQFKEKEFVLIKNYIMYFNFCKIHHFHSIYIYPLNTRIMKLKSITVIAYAVVVIKIAIAFCKKILPNILKKIKYCFI